jgi:hypothetical protein
MKLCMVPVSRIEDRDGYAFRWREAKNSSCEEAAIRFLWIGYLTNISTRRGEKEERKGEEETI